jgi:hypothetical protein
VLVGIALERDHLQHFTAIHSQGQILITTDCNFRDKFVQAKGSLARFDTPVRISLRYLEEVQLHLVRATHEDLAFFHFVTIKSGMISSINFNNKANILDNYSIF